MRASLVETLLRSRVAVVILAMLQAAVAVEYSASTTLTSDSYYDYVIIGGGTAGSVIATRLAEKKKFSVLVIEAGGDPPPQTVFPKFVTSLMNSRINWNYTAANDGYSFQCHINHDITLGIGRMLGGTSELNYMIYSRGHVRYYEQWYRITKDPVWKWQNVLPYYIKSETVCDEEIMKSCHKVYHGTEGPIHVTRVQSTKSEEYLEAYKEAGNELTIDGDGCKLGYYQALITVYDGKRQGGASAYLTRVKNNPYLTIAKNSLATKIIFDNYNNAVAVKVINDKNQTVVVKAKKEIILTAGAVKSPQLLMLSGIGPKGHLKEKNIEVIVDLPQVGRNFHDHTGVVLPHKTNRPTQPPSLDPGEYITPLFTGFAALDKSSDFPDYNSINFIATNTKTLLELCSNTFTFNSKICKIWSDESKNSEVLVSLVTNVDTKSRGQITLASANPEDQPMIVLGIYSNDDDLDAMVDYVVDYLKVEDTDFFKKINAERIDATNCNAFTLDSREYWRCYILCMMTTMGHYGGTCAMGTVVDGHLRVKGVKRLRIGDASVMPSIVNGNTQQPVIMIAEKLAQFLIDEWETELPHRHHRFY